MSVLPPSPLEKGGKESQMKSCARNLVLERVLRQRSNLFLEELVRAGPDGLVAPVVEGQERGEEVTYTQF